MRFVYVETAIVFVTCAAFVYMYHSAISEKILYIYVFYTFLFATIGYALRRRGNLRSSDKGGWYHSAITLIVYPILSWRFLELDYLWGWLGLVN